jgi:hypothetical protein
MKWLKVTQNASKNIFQKKLIREVTFYLLWVLTVNYLKQKKTQKMKKVLFVVALGAFAACGSGANTEAKIDSAAVKVDSAAVKVDSAAVKVDSAAAKVDSAAKK